MYCVLYSEGQSFKRGFNVQMQTFTQDSYMPISSDWWKARRWVRKKQSISLEYCLYNSCFKQVLITHCEDWANTLQKCHHLLLLILLVYRSPQSPQWKYNIRYTYIYIFTLPQPSSCFSRRPHFFPVIAPYAMQIRVLNYFTRSEITF